MIDLVSVDYTSLEATKESEARIKRLTEHFYDLKKQSRDTRRPAAVGGLEGPSHAEAGTRKEGGVQVMVLRHLNPMQAVGAAFRSCHRFSLLLGRALRQTLRDTGTNLVRFGVSALLAWVIGTLYGYQGSDITEASVGDRVTIIAQACHPRYPCLR